MGACRKNTSQVGPKPGIAFHRWIVACFALLFSSALWSQPYVDAFQLRYTHGFRNNNAAATPFKHLWAGSDIPLQLKKDTYLLLSPFYEQWRIDSAGKEEIFPVVRSLVLPVGLIIPLQPSGWTLTVIPTLRWNGEKLFADRTFQAGGVAFLSFARKPKQKFRFGFYANSDFFGLFMWPLLGADWRINEKNHLFGLLPGRMTLEHEWSKKLYGGITFRALTNSYRLADGQYLRLSDNQVSVHLDYYPARRLCLTLEPGYGIARNLRTGIKKREYLTNIDMGDGPFIKLSSAYRIRL